MIKRLVKQIEKQIEVIASFYHTDDQTIFLETALYKVNLNHFLMKNIFKKL